MSKKKNILITGASGAVGSEILNQISLLGDLYNITVFDIKTKESISCFRKYKHTIEIVYGDIAKQLETSIIKKNLPNNPLLFINYWAVCI